MNNAHRKRGDYQENTMMKRNDHRQSRAGIATMEAAFLLPIFFMIFMGIVDFSRYHWTHNVVRDAAYEGARMAILNEATQPQIESIIITELQTGGVDSEYRTITVGARVPDEPVDVTVAVPFSFYFIDSIISSVGENTEVSATAVMTHER